MNLFPIPHGNFIGELEVGLRVGSKIEVDEDFMFWDGDHIWDVPRHFIHDGASFPWWLRWIPSIVAVLVMWRFDDIVRAIIYPAILQALVGFPLESDVLEAAAVHDFGYYEGARKKWECDRAFYRALWNRIYLDYTGGRFGVVRAWLRLFRAAIWTGFVFVGGFAAWWGHRRRERKGKRR